MNVRVTVFVCVGGRCFGCQYRCDCVCGYVGVVLAVNVKAMESRNMSKEAMFYDVLLRFTAFYLYTLTFVMLHSLLVIFSVKFILLHFHFMHLF